jgi:hypothetical protein
MTDTGPIDDYVAWFDGLSPAEQEQMFNQANEMQAWYVAVPQWRRTVYDLAARIILGGWRIVGLLILVLVVLFGIRAVQTELDPLAAVLLGVAMFLTGVIAMLFFWVKRRK